MTLLKKKKQTVGRANDIYAEGKYTVDALAW